MKKTDSLNLFFLLFWVICIGLSQNASAQEAVIYSTGFESSDGFTAGTVYNNTTVAYTGNTGEQWGTYYGTPSTTGPISGSQSMQMRWYTSSTSNLGYTFTNFDLANVTKVEFKAANTSGINMIASYSTDGGTNWNGDQTFTLSSTTTDYTYNISPTGEFDNVRIRFQLTFSSAPSGTSRLYIDDVTVYGIEAASENPPVVTSETFEGYVGQAASFQIQATESPSSYAIVLGTLPSGLSLDTSTGIISGIPETPVAGSVNVTATNDAGTSAPATITIEINQGTQTVTPPFTDISKYDTDPDFDLPEATDQGITINYNSTNTAVATISGNTITIEGVGTTTIEAQNGGSIDYLPFDESFTLTVTEEGEVYNGIGTFTKITSASEITNGYYVIAYGENYAMNNVHNGTYFDRTAITVTDGQIINPDAAMVWKIETSGAGKSIFNEASAKYVSYTGSSNNVQAVDAVTTDNQRWDITENGELFEFSNMAVTERDLKYNSSAPRFACYTSGQNNLTIYKLGEAPSDPALIINPSELSGFTYITGEGPSASQTFEVSGVNLDGSDDVAITVSGTDFEVSLDDENYSNSVSLNDYDGTPTDIYVRLAAGLAINDYNSMVSLSGYSSTNTEVTLSGEVTDAPEPFSLPYSNGLRNQDDIDEAEGYGFIFNGTELQTSAGGYVRMPLNSNIVSPAIDFSQYDALSVSFSATTFGGNSGQQLTVMVSNNDGADYTTLDTFDIPEDYETLTQSIDLSSLNGTSGRIKFEMTGGSNQIRFRDLNISAGAVTWTTANEWSNGTGPTIDDDVVVMGDLETTSGFSAKTLTVEDGGSLTISAGNTVTVDGAVINNAATEDFVVSNNACLIQNIDDPNINEGSITVIRNNQPFKRLDYTMWSSPVNGQQIQAFSPETLPERIYTYEGTSGYVQVADPSIDFEAGKGILFRAPNNWNQDTPETYTGQFAGVPFNGTTGIPTHAGSFTSVGNPYASNIDADLLMMANSGISTLYFWTNTNPASDGTYTGNNYATYTFMGGAGTTGAENDETNAPTGVISVGQGFIVETTDNSVEFNNGMRVSDATSFFKTNDVARHRLWLELAKEDGLGFNQILIGYMDGATQGIDHQIDGKMFDYEGDAIYSLINNESFTIQGRALPFEKTDVVPLGFRATENNTFTISLIDFDGLFADGEATIYLKDHLLNITHNLMESAYTFQSEAGEFNTRFEIVYEDDGTMTNNELNANAVIIYTHNGDVVVDSKSEKIESVEVYDLQGRIIHENPLVNANLYKTNSCKGILVVKVKTQSGKTVTKKVINK